MQLILSIPAAIRDIILAGSQDTLKFPKKRIHGKPNVTRMIRHHHPQPIQQLQNITTSIFM
jgi:hypothetical protein